MARMSIRRYLNVSGFYLYLSFMALMHTFEMSMLVIWVQPSSNISSLSLELPAPTLRMRCPLSTWVVMISFSPLNLWYQSKGSGSLNKTRVTCCIDPTNTPLFRTDSFKYYNLNRGRKVILSLPFEGILLRVRRRVSLLSSRTHYHHIIA